MNVNRVIPRADLIKAMEEASSQIHQIPIATADNCDNIPVDKRELWRIRRELLSLTARLDKLILSQD